MPMSPRLLRPRSAAIAGDSDVRNYIAAVEIADGQQLEQAVKDAIRDFILGCKTDGIWSAIRASCILMGARTLSGCLTPLVGSAPTNNNFVTGDYNRKTGLLGNGSTKYLNSNRNNNADPQNNKHMAVYLGSALTTSASFRAHLGIVGDGGSNTGASLIGTDATTNSARYRNNGNTVAVVGSSAGASQGLSGSSRSSSSTFDSRAAGSSSSNAATSETPVSGTYAVFARQQGSAIVDSYSDARIAFYSIGESLTLSLLDSRVTTLYNAIGAAIP